MGIPPRHLGGYNPSLISTPSSLHDCARRMNFTRSCRRTTLMRMRATFSGKIWSKQFFYYDIGEWIKGDPGQLSPPSERKHGRNAEWHHLNNADIISMPDKWEYPWYAAWDLAFHCIPVALVDPDFAKEQLILLLREWYMHPNGQLPAYEW